MALYEDQSMTKELTDPVWHTYPEPPEVPYIELVVRVAGRERRYDYERNDGLSRFRRKWRALKTVGHDFRQALRA
jgi:hypothetical protein